MMVVFDIKRVIGGVLSFLLLYVGVLFFTVLFVTASRTYSAFKHSDSMMVEPDSVVVDGNEMVSRDTILLLAGLDVPVSYIDVNSAKMEKEIELHPWVSEALVTAVPPDAVHILISEYEPAAVAVYPDKNGEKGRWVVDADGHSFKRLFPGEDFKIHLPLITVALHLDTEDREAAVRTALRLIHTWNTDNPVCRITTVRFSVVSGFVAHCRAGNELVTELDFGELTDVSINSTLSLLKTKFIKIAEYYWKKNRWIYDYDFDEKGNEYRVIIGKIQEVDDNAKR